MNLLYLLLLLPTTVVAVYKVKTKMLHQLLPVILLSTVVDGIPIDDFFPFNGQKVCLMDATTGLVYTNNMIDDFGVPITDLNPSDCHEFRLTPNDDASSQNISISSRFAFFNKHFENLFVSNYY